VHAIKLVPEGTSKFAEESANNVANNNAATNGLALTNIAKKNLLFKILNAQLFNQLLAAIGQDQLVIANAFQ
jgi:hypothetical protein